MAENFVLHGSDFLPGAKFSSFREEHFPSGFFFKLSFHSDKENPLGKVFFPLMENFAPGRKSRATFEVLSVRRPAVLNCKQKYRRLFFEFSLYYLEKKRGLGFLDEIYLVSSGNYDPHAKNLSFHVPNVHYVSHLSFSSRVWDWKCTVNRIFCIANKQKPWKKAWKKVAWKKVAWKKVAWKKVAWKKVAWKKVMEEMRGRKYCCKIQWKLATKLKTITRNTTGQVRSGFSVHGASSTYFLSGTARSGRFGDRAQTQALSGRRFLASLTRPVGTRPSSSTFCQALHRFRPVRHVQQRQRPCNLTVSFKRNWRKIRYKKWEIYLN